MEERDCNIGARGRGRKREGVGGGLVSRCMGAVDWFIAHQFIFTSFSALSTVKGDERRL